MTVRNIKTIEEQEPNKLKAEIYRLRYEHGKLEAAKKMLQNQKDEIDKVRKMKNDLQESMKNYKLTQEKNRKEMKDQIEKQKQDIADKQRKIKERSDELKKTEEEYKAKLEVLAFEYEN